MLMNISKNFAEINLFEKATEILDIMIKMDDEDLEGWYLLAFYHYQLKNYQYSMKCLKRFNKIQMKMKILHLLIVKIKKFSLQKKMLNMQPSVVKRKI